MREKRKRAREGKEEGGEGEGEREGARGVEDEERIEDEI